MADERNRGIAMLDLAELHAPLEGDLHAAFARVLASQRFIMGAEVSEFEAEVAAYIGAPHAIGVSSGTDALLAALMALEIGPGDEVITSPFSFFATAGCVVRVGAKPVFVDIEPDTFNLNAELVEDAITDATRAIMPVHLFGQAADLCSLRGLCDARQLALIEDAAQAIGASRAGMRVGAVGDAACFSFFPAKNLGALGDAGLVTTQDPHLADRLRVLRTHGAAQKYHHPLVGGNFRLDALQAALLRVKLPSLSEWTGARRRNAARYDSLFAEAALPPDALITPHRVDPGHVYNQYVVQARDRDGLRAHLAAASIESEVYYPAPLHLQPCFADLGYAPGSLPIAEQACEAVLALPVHPTLTTGQLEQVARAVIEFYRA